MARLQLSVLQMEDSWRLLMDGRRIGRFPLRSSALDCAAEIARFSRAEGVEVEFLAQTDVGELVNVPASA